MSDAKISLIIPVFNNVEYLKECFDSAFEQTIPFHEVIIVDDCSSDKGVIPVIKSFEKKSNIKVVYLSENSGICRAQDRAILESTGDYIGFLDCDDKLSYNACEIVSAYIDKSKKDYYFSNRIHIDKNGATIDTYDPSRMIERYGGIEQCILEHMVASHFKVISKHKLLEVGGHPEGSEGIQDWVVALNIINNNSEHIRLPLYSHRLHDKQTTSTAKIKNIRRVNEFRREKLNQQFPNLLDKSCENELNFLNKYLDIKSLDYINNMALVLSPEGVKLANLQCLAVDDNALGKAETVLLMSACWVDLGLYIPTLLKQNIKVGLFVAQNEANSHMARWYNSYFNFLIFENSLSKLAVVDFIPEGINYVVSRR